MNLTKSYEFFQPELVEETIHIIGCGSVGSTIAELLTRFGLTNFVLYDFDFVEEHNLANQMFTLNDVGKPKVECVANMMCAINPEIRKSLRVVPNGWKGQRLAGYVFLCVDNIDLRREIAEKCKDNEYVQAMFDFRTRLTDAQHYAADWSNEKHVEAFIGTMQFSHDEAKAATPVSACNTELSVAPTVRMICNLGVMNFINFVRSGKRSEMLKKMILVDTNTFQVDAI